MLTLSASSTQTETYSVSGSNLIETDSDGTTTTSQFCISGNQMKYQSDGQLFVLTRQ